MEHIQWRIPSFMPICSGMGENTMVKFSRYAHTFELDDNAVALYHSLRMKPVYLNMKSYEGLQAWLASPLCVSIEDAPEEIKIKSIF